MHQGLTLQGHRVVDVFHPNVVTGGPAGLLHPVAEHELTLRGHIGIDAHGDFERRRRAQRRQGLHGEVKGGNFSLQGSDVTVDALAAFLDDLKARFEKGGGLHEALQIDPGVFYLEVLVLKQKLFLSVEERSAGLGVLNVFVQLDPKVGESDAFLVGVGAPQGVGVVAVRHAQHREIPAPGQPDFGRIDGGVEVGEHKNVGSCVQGHVRQTLDLCTLLIHDDVVNVTGYRGFIRGQIGQGGTRRGNKGEAQHQGDQARGQKKAFKGGVGSNHGGDVEGEWKV